MQHHIINIIFSLLWITICAPLTAFLAYGWYSIGLFAIWHYVVLFCLCLPTILTPWFIADIKRELHEVIKDYRFSKHIRSVTRNY